MTDTQFETFLVGGLMVLVIGVLAVAWLLWRRYEIDRDGVNQALDGVSYEYLANLQRALGEFGALADGLPGRSSMLMPAKYPMLDMINSLPLDIDRKATCHLTQSIERLEAARLDLRSALARGGDSEVALSDAMEVGLDSIIALYLWDDHRGVLPVEAHSTRSRAVRQWMKDRLFPVDVYPGQNIRDEIVKRLRQQGMTLTPKPLNLTSSEYWSRRYDRYKDPRAPFGARKLSPKTPDGDLTGAEPGNV